MFTTGLMQLHEAGQGHQPARASSTASRSPTFAAGTPELYAWLDGNEDVAFLPVELVNSPEVIAAQPRRW